MTSPNCETVKGAIQMFSKKKSKLFSQPQPMHTPVEEMIQRGRLVADRTIGDDLFEKKTEAIGLEGVHDELSARLSNIGEQIEALQLEEQSKGSQLADNRVRLRGLKKSILDMELSLLGDK